MCAKSFLKDSDIEVVEKAISDAEKRTSAEIVCAIATESGRYDRAEALSGFLGALLTLAVWNYLYFLVAGNDAAGLSVVWQMVAVGFGFAAGYIKASYMHWLRRFFTFKSEMEDEADRAATVVFAENGLMRTAGRGGVLLYVSLYERQVVVLADDGAMAATGEGFPEALRDIAIAELQAGRRCETFTKTIEEAVNRLSEALPARSDDQNELSNDLLIYHPRP